MNKYDLEHVTTAHPVMTAAEWQSIYREAWDLYYSTEHIETILRRAKASGIKPVRLLNHILQFYFTFIQENVHPLQGGYFRRKVRRHRRSGMPRENPVVFYPRRVGEVVATHARLAAFYLLPAQDPPPCRARPAPLHRPRAHPAGQPRPPHPPRPRAPDRRRRLSRGPRAGWSAAKLPVDSGASFDSDKVTQSC